MTNFVQNEFGEINFVLIRYPMFPIVLIKCARARCCVPPGIAYQLVTILVFGARVLHIAPPQRLTRLPLVGLLTAPMPRHHQQHMLSTMLFQVLSPRLLDLVYQLQDLEQDRVPDRTPTHPNLPLPVVWQLVLKQMLGLSNSTKPGRYLPISHPCKHGYTHPNGLPHYLPVHFGNRVPANYFPETRHAF